MISLKWLALLLFLGVLSVEDIRYREVHSAILYAFMVSGIILWIIRGQFSVLELAGGMLCGGIIWICSMAMPDRIGSADGIVFAATGAFLGLMDNLRVMMISALLAGTGALIAVTVFKKDRDGEMPFIPYVLAGCMVLAFIRRGT